MKRLLAQVCLSIVCWLGLALAAVAAESNYQQITSLTSATALTIPGTSYQPVTSVVIHAEGGNIRWRNDGTNPTATVGNVIYAGGHAVVAERLSEIRLIQETTGTKANIHYRKLTPSNVVPMAGPLRPVPYFVSASNAPAREKSAADYSCTGTTHNEVQIQAAIDQAEDDGNNGAVVELGAGSFYLGVPTGTTVYTGSGETNTVGSQSVITVSSWDGSYAITDVTAGDVIRIYHDGAGTDPATNYDDIMFTVKQTSASPDKITLHGRLKAEYNGGDTINFTRVPFALNLKGGAVLKGQGRTQTRLFLSSGENVSGIQVTGSLTGIKDLDIQCLPTPSAYNRLRNGFHVNNLCYECDIRSVSVWYIDGDGASFNEGHGVRWAGDSWLEACRGYGITATGTSELTLENVMNEVNYKPAFVLKRSSRFRVIDCYGVYNLASSSPWLVAYDINNSTIKGNTVSLSAQSSLIGFNLISCATSAINNNTIWFSTTTTGGTGFLLDGYAQHNTFTGNAVYMQNSTAVGINTGNAYHNAIVGNAFYASTAGSDPITQGTNYGLNTVERNAGQEWQDRVAEVRMTNATGSTIPNRYFLQRVTTSLLNVEKATDTGDHLVVGSVQSGDLVNNEIDYITTHGPISYGPINSDEAAGQAIAVGDPLCISGSVAGTVVEATAGDYVVAIAKQTQTASGSGVVMKSMFILPREERYTHP